MVKVVSAPHGSKQYSSQFKGYGQTALYKKHIHSFILSSSYALDPRNTKAISLDLWIHIAHGLVKCV